LSLPADFELDQSAAAGESRSSQLKSLAITVGTVEALKN
jgi:hypothetical protein